MLCVPQQYNTIQSLYVVWCNEFVLNWNNTTTAASKQFNLILCRTQQSTPTSKSYWLFWNEFSNEVITVCRIEWLRWRHFWCKYLVDKNNAINHQTRIRANLSYLMIAFCAKCAWIHWWPENFSCTNCTEISKSAVSHFI